VTVHLICVLLDQSAHGIIFHSTLLAARNTGAGVRTQPFQIWTTERPWMSFATAQGWPMVRTLRSRATFWLAASDVIGNTVSGRP
jgi:hypothetical protein